MAMRVKNIAAGFYDATGFHPIRSSADYDPDRAGDDYPQRTAPAPRRKGKRMAKRKRNPIPSKWVAANVKRVGNDIQVMLFPKGKVARRRVARRRTARQTVRRTARRRR
jgi:hypothetical protein